MKELDAINGYHAHVYYDEGARPAAAELREAIAGRFRVQMGRWRDQPVGPHVRAMFQIAFTVELFPELVPWLMLNRGTLTVLVHPNTDNPRDDHVLYPLWMGEVLDIKEEALRDARPDHEPIVPNTAANAGSPFPEKTETSVPMPLVCEVRRLKMDLCEFPNLLRGHRKCDPDTPAIEKDGTELARGGFNVSDVPNFVRRVCKWGGYPGIGGRVLKRNEESAIAVALRDAHGLALQSRPAEAVERLCRLRDLDISFASKHLKFLAPERAVVLDRIIASRLGYALTPSGYADLLADCDAMLDRIRAEQIPYPFPEEGTWRVSDVEMAIYQKLRSETKTSDPVER